MDTVVGSEFGHRIRTAREKAGLSSKAVAEACGFSSGYYSRLETGQADPPSLGKILTLADFLGINADSLAACAGKMRPELLQRFWSAAVTTLGATAGISEADAKLFAQVQLAKIAR